MALSTVNLCNRISEHQRVSLDHNVVPYISWAVELKHFGL